MSEPQIPTLMQVLREAYEKQPGDKFSLEDFLHFAEVWLAEHPIVTTFYVGGSMGFVLNDSSRCTYSQVDPQAQRPSDATDIGDAVQGTHGG